MLKPVEILVLSLSKAFGTLNYILSGPKLFQERAVSSEVRYCNQMRSYIGQAVLNITGTTGLKRTLVQIVEGVAQEFISKQWYQMTMLSTVLLHKIRLGSIHKCIIGVQ